MKTINKVFGIAICFCLSTVVLAGCSSQQNQQPNFSGVKEVAKLSTLECYYHNVAKFHKDADGWFFGWSNIGEKNMWFEYDGIVQMGIDVEKVSISSPDANGVVAITIPEIEILGRPDIDPESMTDPIEINGLLTTISADEKTQILEDAQSNLVETANNDTVAKAQATERAKNLLEQYVKNVGEAIGRSYTVKWIQAEGQ